MDGLQKFLNYKPRPPLERINFVGISTNNFTDCFYLIDRKRRRVDDEDSNALIKLVRFCSTCHPTVPSKATKSIEKNLSQPNGFIDSSQAKDLLACYL